MAPSEDQLWPLAGLTFGLGDVITTGLSLMLGMMFEGNPVAAALFEEIGLWIIVPWKIAVFILFYRLYLLSPEKYRAGIPLGLFLWGSVVTVWNTFSVVTGTYIVVG